MAIRARQTDDMTNVLIYLVLPFLGSILIGVPVVFAIGIGCFVFLAFSGTTIPMLVLVTEMASGLDSYALLALPAFVMTGELLNRCGLTDRLVNLANAAVGWIRGGLAHVTTVTGMLLATISGSALADAATLGPVVIPAMIRERFPPGFAAAITAAAACIGAIIPPSVPLVIIGSQLGMSIGGLFLAGVIPGLLTGIALMITSWLLCRFRGFGAPRPFEGVSALGRHSIRALPALTIPAIILGGILGGVFSPTEAGVIAVIYTTILGRLVYRNLSLRSFGEALMSTAQITGAAVIIVAISLVMGRILAFEQIPQKLVALMSGVTTEPVLVFLIVVILLLVVGCVMDAVANMIILGPLLMPICTQLLEMQSFQYGIFLMYALLIGLLTPPLGLALFVVAPIAKVSAEHISVAVLPFIAAMLIVLTMIAFFPALTMWLPTVAGYE